LIHPLAIENVVNIPHCPAAEVFDEQLLLIARMVIIDVPASDGSGGASLHWS
jgi:Mg2+ and Co2+ transporter CorA